jgi:ABC-type Fe3+-citrate transport system substrate-binding protein
MQTQGARPTNSTRSVIKFQLAKIAPFAAVGLQTHPNLRAIASGILRRSHDLATNLRASLLNDEKKR